MRKKSKKINLFLKVLNSVLLSVIFIISILFILIVSENKKEVDLINAKSLLEQNSKTTMRTKELVENIESNLVEPVNVQQLESKNPELEYAIKLFESDINKLISKKFNKPFNFNGTYNCELKIDLKKQNYKILNCNKDAIHKRALSLTMDDIMPLKRTYYNNIDLRNEKILIFINIE